MMGRIDVQKELFCEKEVRNNMELKKKRFHFIDEYRGFVLINMVLYHAIWDLVYIFHQDWRWYKSDIAFYWQQWICWSFIFVSGFCWQMGKRKLRRGIEVFVAGIIITVATLIFMPDSRVLFGVLTLLGSSMLLMIPCDKLFQKLQSKIPGFAFAGAIISFLLFLFVYPVNDGYLGFFEIRMIELPRELYSSMFMTYLGFPEPGFWSTDYFSILPWFFLYMTGYFAYSMMIKKRTEDISDLHSQEPTTVEKVLSKSICPPLGWIGRNSLIIYMLHQPVVYGVLMVWNLIH